MMGGVEFSIRGEIWYWRGPSPFHFVTVPPDAAAEISDRSSELTYGWGCIPATVRLGDTTFTTSLFPKDGGYVVPMKVAARRAERVDLGDVVDLVLVLNPGAALRRR